MIRLFLFSACLLGAQLAQANDQSNSNEDVAELSTINVSGQKANAPVIHTDKLLKVPGAGGDPLKAIEALPGVVLGGFGPFSIPAIRGSSPADNTYITDFVPVGFVFHNDGSSTYNENLIADFQLKAGAWGPQYNNALGAVLNTHLRDPYQEKLSTTLDLSLLRVGGLIEGAVSDDSAFYLSYRESLLQFYVENFIDEDELTFTEVPKNNDYQFKYHWRLNGSSNLRVVANGAHDSVGIEFGPESDELDHEPGLDGGLAADTYFHNQAILYDTILKGGTSTILALSRTEASQSFNAGSLVDITATNFDYRLKNYYQSPLNNGDTLQYGFDANSVDIEYAVTGKDNPCNGEFENCQPASLGEDFTANDILTINSLYVFGAYDLQATPFWQLSLGLGSSINSFSDETTLQPRLSSRYEINSQWTLTGAIGKHHQFHRDFRFIDKQVGTPDLKLPNSDHYVAGFEYLQGDSLSAKLEVYYKDLHDLVRSNPDYENDNTADKYISGISGKAYGLELLINKNLTDRWYGWFSMAYSQTKRTDEVTNKEFNYSLDRPWIVNLVASYEYSPFTTMGFKWRYQSGSLITPLNASDPATQWYQCDDNSFATEFTAACGTVTNPLPDPYLYAPNELAKNSERLPAYHRLDFRIDYTPKTDTQYYFEIINAYNQANVSDYSYDKTYEEKEEVTSLPTIFNFGMKLIY